MIIARRIPKARGYSPWRGVQHSERAIWSQPPVFNKILAGHGFTGGLHCRKTSQGNDPWHHLAPCIPSRKADVAAMWDGISASLNEKIATGRTQVSVNKIPGEIKINR
ncbi:MAG: hypothetical protein ABL860_05250 [Candidatus Nitrotoga sp.]